MGSYHGWDVHSWTSDLRDLLDQQPEFECRFRVSMHLFDQCLQEIFEMYGEGVKPVLEKMRGRYKPIEGGYYDMDLVGKRVNVAHLLVRVWTLVKRINDESIYKWFKETLDDIGLTCLQGDSHRLMFFLVGLVRSINKEEFVY